MGNQCSQRCVSSEPATGGGDGAGRLRSHPGRRRGGRDAGAERILYTSHQAASWDSLFAPQTTHAATEEHLARRGVPFTALRNGFHATTLGYYPGDVLETGRLVAPEDGPVSWTAHADLAEAAVAALVDGVLDGVTAL